MILIDENLAAITNDLTFDGTASKNDLASIFCMNGFLVCQYIDIARYRDASTIRQNAIFYMIRFYPDSQFFRINGHRMAIGLNPRFGIQLQRRIFGINIHIVFGCNGCAILYSNRSRRQRELVSTIILADIGIDVGVVGSCSRDPSLNAIRILLAFLGLYIGTCASFFIKGNHTADIGLYARCRQSGSNDNSP